MSVGVISDSEVSNPKGMRRGAKIDSSGRGDEWSSGLKAGSFQPFRYS